MKNNIIYQILDSTHQWIQYKKKNIPLDSFKKKIKKSKIIFKNHFKKRNPAFILECKKASPLNGVIRKNFNIAKIVKIYDKYADVISVITEEKFFSGSFKYLLKARSYTKKPLLCKDFIIDPYQIYYARYHQADAILLMLSILDNSSYIKLSNIAKNLNLGILTEVHDIQELQRALSLKAEVIGINNRNLKDLSVNLKNTHLIAPLIPKNKVIICESGINNYSDTRLFNGIVDGFLIGSRLMQSKNLEVATRRILFGDNKVCGLTDISSARSAENCGCIYGGLIFVHKSPRFICDSQIKEIIDHSHLKYVGVFQNELHQYILNKVNNYNLYAVQLHGKEDQEFIQKLKLLLPKHVKIWKSISMNKNIVINNNNNIDRYLLDHKNGGTGNRFNWKLIKKFNVSNMMLAGGLTIENCFVASNLGFRGLDFNSGLEISPGIKDSKKIQSVFKILRFYQK